jgi:hypothetical protein
VCTGLLGLAEVEAEFAGRRIVTGLRTEAPGPSLYQRVLGDGFTVLPAPLRALHGPGWGFVANGMAVVDGAVGPGARLVAWLFRFPPAAGHVTVRVEIVPARGRERWTRMFGGRRFVSTLSASVRPGHLVERFGPFRFELAVPVAPAGVLGMAVVRWWFLVVPLPRLLAPISIASESVDDVGRFSFNVEMRLPFRLGRLVRYRGWLAF